MSEQAGIIDFFGHPPLSLLTNRGSVFAGVNVDLNLNAPDGLSSFQDVYGMLWQMYVTPRELGRRIGWPDPDSSFVGDTFQDVLAQVVFMNRLGDGSYIPTLIDDVRHNQRVWLWGEAAPTRVGIHPLPGVYYSLAWFVAA